MAQDLRMGKAARLTKDKPLCKICKSAWHYQTFCPSKPKKPVRATQKPLKRTPIKKMGKHATKWQTTRRQWLKANKAEWYECYLCKTMVSHRAMQLDHVESRARRPDLRYEPSNLKPVHSWCNKNKGSLSVDEYRKLQDDLKNA